jgi:alpha-L-fucosidase
MSSRLLGVSGPFAPEMQSSGESYNREETSTLRDLDSSALWYARLKPVRLPTVLLITLLSVVGGAQAQTPDQPRPLPGPRPSASVVREWQDRKFGLFIHFGLYSMLGGIWQGQKIDNGYSEQIMGNAPISREQYAALARKFNPTEFNADAIVELAQRAGMKFIVITAKHHDGFNMFRTRLTDYNVVEATPYHKDVIAQLSEACANHGMKFGVYYSSIDWHYPQASSYIEGNSNPIPPAHEDFNVGQLQELVTNYGPLSEIWFDMGKPTPAQSARFAQAVHAIQPDVMVSGRVFNYQGDFTVMGDNEVPEFVIDEPWQTPASIYPDTWGYRSWESRTNLQGKIAENILRLAQVVSRGGNYILNIGPEGDGSVVPFEAEVLRGVGEWMHANGEAIYETHAQPFRQLPFGYATVKPGRLYLLVRDWPASGKLQLPGLKSPLKSAYWLVDSRHAPLPISELPGGIEISISGEHRTPPLSVVVAEYTGNLEVASPAQHPDASGAITLTAQSADHFLNYNGYGYEDAPTLYKLRWAIAVETARHYQVVITYQTPSATSKLEFVAGQQHLPATLDINGLPQRRAQAKPIGEVILDAGPAAWIEITPPQPFFKGDKLGVTIDRVELFPIR